MQRRKYRTPGQRVEAALYGSLDRETLVRDNESLRRQLSAAKYDARRANERANRLARDVTEARAALEYQRRSEKRQREAAWKAENEAAELRSDVSSLKRQLAEARPSSAQMEAEHVRALGEKNAEIGELTRTIRSEVIARLGQLGDLNRVRQELSAEQASHKLNREALVRAGRDIRGLRQELDKVRLRRDQLAERFAYPVFNIAADFACPPNTVYAMNPVPPGSGLEAKLADEQATRDRKLEERLVKVESRLAMEMPAASREVLDQRLRSLERKEEKRREKERRRNLGPGY